jgi:glycine hydroxymethyltransferase
MREAEMAEIGKLIGEALDHAQDEAVLARIRGKVLQMTVQFPLYASRLKR